MNLPKAQHRTIGRALLAALFLAALACAQSVVAPTPEPAGPASGDNLGDYNFQNSFELGYRFREVTGNLGKYRSDVNYGNGLRLLSSFLRVNSRDGHGWLFDEIVLRTQGLGADPYELSSLEVRKNRLYRYDLTWRLQDYYNPALPIASGLHLLDTERRLQDHDLTLFPESRFRLFAGYSRNLQTGPALSTVHLFDDTNPGIGEFPLFTNVRRLENEYRLGGQATLFGAQFTVLHGWVNFSDLEPQSLAATSDFLLGSPLQQFQRVQPYHSSSPYWRINLLKQGKAWSAAARYSYAGTRGHFIFDETAFGLDRFGAGQNVQTALAGTGARPMSTGNLTLSYFPGSKLTVTNQTSFYNTRMDGDNVLRQIQNATLTGPIVNFQFLGIRDIVNSTDANYRASRWLGFYGSYSFSTRRIESVETFGAQSLRARQTNDLHDGVAGVRLMPLRPLTINLDAEIGRASYPIFPIGERNYHVLNARVRYRARSLTLEAAARANYNLNSVSLTEASSHGRNYSLDAAWTPRSWFGLDASYAKLHLDTLSGIAYFANAQLVTGERSLYISNLHAANLIAHFDVRKRAELGFGYSRTQDLGDGRSSPASSSEGGSALSAFLAAQTFPLTFESPFARLSVKLHERLRWNAGWQYYRYRERFDPIQRYHANTGYTSVSWSF